MTGFSTGSGFVLGGPSLAVGERHQRLQLRRVETDQIEIEALVAQPSQLLLNQGTRSNPLAIRLRNSSSGRSDQPDPARRTKKKARPLLDQIYKTCDDNSSAKKLQEQEPPSLENR